MTSNVIGHWKLLGQLSMAPSAARDSASALELFAIEVVLLGLQLLFLPLNRRKRAFQIFGTFQVVLLGNFLEHLCFVVL